MSKKENSITVNKVIVDSLNFDSNMGQMFFIKGTNYIHLFGTRYTADDDTTRNFEMTCTFKDGFMTDGASAPTIAQVFVPKYKKEDNIYNAAPFIHDALYMHKGQIEGAELTREECDDILRGIWRIAGMSRFIAGVSDLGIELIAGSDKHWGDDYNDCKHLFKAKIQYT